MYYYKKKSMWIFTPEEKESAKNISVVDYLTKNYGFTFKKEGRNYRCREHDSFVVKQDERTWYWNSRRLGGGDVIEFVSQYENKSYADALVAIINPTHSERPRYHTAPTVFEPEEKVLELPPKSEKKYSRVFAYLTKSRCLSPQIVRCLIHKKFIYEDKRGNCVFVGYDKNGNAAYAQMRTTNTNSKFRMDAYGSDKENSFYIKGYNKQKVFVFESPIDLLSHATLVNISSGNPREWLNSTRLSLGGNSDVALERFVQDYSEIEEIYFCVDNDKGGDIAIERYAQKYEDMGYKVNRILPKNKDFNEDLVKLCSDNKRLIPK